MDPTVQIYPTDHSRQFRFSMEAFKFIGRHDQVRTLCDFYPQMHREAGLMFDFLLVGWSSLLNRNGV